MNKGWGMAYLDFFLDNSPTCAYLKPKHAKFHLQMEFLHWRCEGGRSCVQRNNEGGDYTGWQI